MLSCCLSQTVEQAATGKYNQVALQSSVLKMHAAALLKRQIYRLQFLHRNVKLDVLNGAHRLLPSIVFRA